MSPVYWIFLRLLFVDGNLTIKGNTNKVEKLTAVNKDLHLDYPADYVFPNLTSAGSVTIKDPGKVTKVDQYIQRELSAFTK